MSQEDLLRRNAEWEQAILRRDREGADALLAPDYALVLVHPERIVATREQWMAMLPDYVVHSWDVEERVVDVSGDTASIMQRVVMKATVAGTDRSGPFVMTDTWLRSTGEWRVWRRHSTPLETGALAVPGS
jgi:ketosteroid isomerase-like protein